MFDLRIFIKMGLMDAVGKLADYQVILNAAGWHEKGVLTTEDLAELQAAIDARRIAAEEPVGEETEEDPVAEETAEEPVAEEPVAEEPVAEEPVAEEPVAEEPVAEEPVTEETEAV